MNNVTRFLLLLPMIVTLACGKLTPADKGRLLKSSIDASKTGCLVMLVDPTIPREESTLEYCSVILKGCPKLEIKNEVRSVP